MSMPSRIAFVSPRFAEGATIGGAETLMRELACRLARQGCRVDFLTTCARNHFTWEDELPPGSRTVGPLQVHFFPVDRRDVTAFLEAQSRVSRRAASESDERAWLANSVNSTALCEHIRAHQADYDRVVVGPYLFGLTHAVSSQFRERTLLLPCLHDEAFAYVQAIGDMFRRAGGFLFNSEPERDLAIRLYGLDPSLCAVVGMGLDPFATDAAAFRTRRGLAEPYVLYAGRREALKGTPLLLDYMAAFRGRTHRDVKLVLTGGGTIAPPPEIAPHLIDLGFVDEQEKHDAMAGATTFCHPSVNESLSIVILESWLAGTPVLVHAGCDVTRWQCERSRGGLWFRNYPEFEEQLLLLLDQPDLRSALGEAGRRYVLREYAWEAIETRLAGALERLPRTVKDG